jgi:hypothetical protein
LWYFGIFFPFWYFVPRKIWQPRSRPVIDWSRFRGCRPVFNFAPRGEIDPPVWMWSLGVHLAPEGKVDTKGFSEISD